MNGGPWINRLTIAAAATVFADKGFHQFLPLSELPRGWLWFVMEFSLTAVIRLRTYVWPPTLLT